MFTDILLIVFFLLLHAFFNAMQFPLAYNGKGGTRRTAKKGSRCSSIITSISRNEVTFAAAMQAASIIFIVTSGVFVYELPVSFSYNPLNAPVFILTVKILAVFLAAIIFSSAMPDVRKWIEPGTALCIIAMPVYAVFIVLYPLGLLMKRTAGAVTGGVTGKAGRILRDIVFSDNMSGMIKKEAVTAVNEIAGKAEDELRLYQNALEFANVRVRDCMIPRPEIVAADVGSVQDEVIQKFVETGLSKIIIYEESIDNILGYITSKELFGKPESIRSVLHPIFFVTETMPASRLLKKFIQEKKSIAVVVDEFGVISGLITIEDVIEEIFGEIEDEHDVDQFIEKIQGEDEYIFSGRLEVDYLNEKYMLGIPENEAYSTLAGFVLHHHGSIPGVNDVITIGSITVKILKVSRNRIDLVKVTIGHERDVRA